MNNKKIWRLISSLKTDEYEYFINWLKLEWGERQEYCQKLAHLLCRAAPTPPDIQMVWKDLYGNLPYDDARMRKLNGDLTAKMEEFLVVQALKKSPDTCKILLLRELNSRGLNDLYKKKLSHTLKQHQQNPLKDSTYYKTLYELAVEQQRNTNYQPGQKGTDNRLDDPYELIHFAFDSWWLHEKVALATSNIALEKKFGVKYPDNFLNTALAGTKATPFAEQKWLNLRARLLQLLRGEGKEAPGPLLEALRHHAYELTEFEVRNLHALLLNYFVGIHNRLSDRESAEQIFKLYEWAIADEFVFQNGYLPIPHYRNLITVCLRVQDFDRAWNYLNDFKELLDPALRENAYLLSLGSYHAEKGDHQKVIRMFKNLEFKDIFDEIRGRSYVLQSHYEMGNAEHDWLFSQIENLIRTIRKHKGLSDNHRAPYLNRLKLFKRMLNAHTRQDWEKVHSAIESTHPIDHKVWLLKQAQIHLA
ncbi:MAG: hypothetical protein AAGI38_15760 [Bacteroidota bacterium]